MAYLEKYNFNFFSTRDLRNPSLCDEYEVRILQDDESSTPIEIEAQENPVIINYNNSSDDKLLALRGSECTLNLIATEEFQLEDLYTENERNWLVEIYRRKEDITINWSLDETPPGISFVDIDLQIFVNGVLKVQKFTDDSGSFAAKKGDTVFVSLFGATAPASGIGGVNVEITGLATQRTTTYPLSIDTTFIAEGDTIISAYSTWSADTYTAIRSAVFNPACNVTEKIVFTKTYTSTTSQAAAQSLADADSGFDAEGQAYADANAICYDYTDLIWRGFIIPDGCQESFAFTPYTIQVNAVDGLGLLKNLSFVENDGNFFLGKKTWIEIIYGCLNRLGIPNMDIYTCVNIYEITMTEGDANDPLALSYVNAERFLKDDQYSPMNCQEVLQAVLQQWTACIIQSEGHWYIYRPNEAALNGTLAFRKYVNGVYDSVVTKNIDVLLGGYSEGVGLAPLYHVNTDQLKMIEKPFKTASINYKYADIKTVDNRLANPTLSGASRGTCTGDPALPCNDFTIPSWTKFGTMFNGFAPGGGIIFFDETFINVNNYYKNDSTFYLPVNYSLRLTIDYQNPDPLFTTDMNFGIELVSGSVTYYLQTDGTWAAVLPLVEYYRVRSEEGAGGTLVIESLPFPIDGNVTIKLFSPSSTSRNIIYTNITAGRFIKVGNQKGEIHTTEQTGEFSFASDTINVFNGDGLADGYLGTIFRSDEETATTLWKRRGLTESPIARPNFATKPFLRIAVEEIQRMYGAPFVKFEGSIANYFNPLSRFTINLINGKFMPTGLSYDLQSNICKATLTRIINEEVDLDYKLEPDFGETTKVLVK